MRRAFVVAALAAAVFAGNAQAAIVLFFNHPIARAGVHETVFTETKAFKRQPNRTLGIVVFLIPFEAVRYPFGPYASIPSGWIRVGELHSDAGGVGRASFVVPRLTPGPYTSGIWCSNCRPRGAYITGSLLGSTSEARRSVLQIR